MKLSQKFRQLYVAHKVSPLAKTIFWTSLVVLTLSLIFYQMTIGASSDAQVRIWYFYGLTLYILIGAVIIAKSDNANAYGTILAISMAVSAILIIGFLIHLFASFPPVLQTIFGWPAIVSVVILGFTAVIELHVAHWIDCKHS